MDVTTQISAPVNTPVNVSAAALPSTAEIIPVPETVQTSITQPVGTIVTESVMQTPAQPVVTLSTTQIPIPSIWSIIFWSIDEPF